MRARCWQSGASGRRGVRSDIVLRAPESGDRGQAESRGCQHGQAANHRRGKGASKQDLGERGEAWRDENREAGDCRVKGGSQPYFDGIGLCSQ